jgi:rhodanese-related sulfurtransferase
MTDGRNVHVFASSRSSVVLNLVNLSAHNRDVCLLIRCTRQHVQITHICLASSIFPYFSVLLAFSAHALQFICCGTSPSAARCCTPICLPFARALSVYCSTARCVRAFASSLSSAPLDSCSFAFSITCSARRRSIHAFRCQLVLVLIVKHNSCSEAYLYAGHRH